MSSPIWISHRGYCRDAEENTAESFRAALAVGFEHLETDLRATADGHVVLAHDSDLQRICGKSCVVEKAGRPMIELLRLRNGERFLFIDEFLSEFSGYRWIFDIKPESALRTLDVVLNWWHQPQYSEFFSHRVRFLFWDKGHQDYLQQRRPEAVCMARLNQCRRAGFSCLLSLSSLAGIKPGVTYALPPRFKGLPTLSSSVVERYQSRGGRVLAYLPDTEEETLQAVEAGVNEVLTNHLPLS